MSRRQSEKPLFLHPTDFSAGSHVAFCHALRLALDKKSGLSLLHVGAKNNEAHWENFPAVRGTLTQWNLLDSTAMKSDVYDQLGITIEKVETHTKSVVDGISSFGKIHKIGTDMLILSTAGREGLPRWLQPSVAEKVAREIRMPTLFVPQNSRTFVNPDNGAMELNRILIPVDHAPSPQISITYTENLLRDLNLRDCKATFIHAGKGDTPPYFFAEDNEHVKYQTLTAEGNSVDAILHAAEELQSQLIVMSTQGHDGFLDALRGSTTERVLREAPCPVLTLST